MLPKDLPACRVLTFSYPATVASVLGKTSSDRILQHAQTLVAELVADREVCYLVTDQVALAAKPKLTICSDGRRSSTPHYLCMPFPWWHNRKEGIYFPINR